MQQVVSEVRHGEHQPGDADRDRGIRSAHERRDDAGGDQREVQRTDVADEVLVERAVDADPGAEADPREDVVEGLRAGERPDADEGAEGVEDPEDDASECRVHT